MLIRIPVFFTVLLPLIMMILVAIVMVVGIDVVRDITCLIYIVMVVGGIPKRRREVLEVAMIDGDDKCLFVVFSH